MAVLAGLLRPFEIWNDRVLPLGRWLAILALAAMVLAILVQVVFRYLLNHALPWPDEAARFCMLWLTGLIAPLAYRRGGFVAIDMAGRALPRRPAALLSLLLLSLSLAVLVLATRIGWSEVTGFGGRFATASLWLPDLAGGWIRVPRSWMMASLLLGLALMIPVTVELMLRALIVLAGGGGGLRPLARPGDELMAE